MNNGQVLKIITVSACGREVRENESFYSDECIFNYTPNDRPYENEE
jgi:hypothetical protein